MEVEDNAKVVEEADEDALGLVFGDLVGLADLGVVIVGDVVFFEVFEFFFDLEPSTGEEIADVGELADFAVDGLLELLDASAVFAGGGDEGFDVGVFFA